MMEHLQRFFEEMDEFVYISDTQTHQLVYMNRRMRESLGYQRPEDYMGKLCYEVLQGSAHPCAFCNNQQLKEGQFLSWVHKNPVFNKRYLVKDSLLTDQGRSYRIEVAVDVDAEVVCNTPYYYARSETILNECMRQMFSTTHPNDALELLLSYLGRTFQCDRAYVFEIDSDERVDNTYEWCREGVEPQKDILQKVPLSSIDWWMQVFSRDEVILIRDLEDIRAQYPMVYAMLKPQNVNTLAAGPVSSEGKVTGFLGVDNPNREMMGMLAPIINVVGRFVASLLSRRDLLRRLHALSYHDPLTNLYNRNAMNAMFEQGARLGSLKQLGVVYCDITSLKQTNDSMGHDAGDRLIRHCVSLLQETLQTPWIYRSGGDEFVALFGDFSRERFEENVQALRHRIQQDQHHMAVGYAWSDQPPFDLDDLICRADQVMYQDKRDYYRINGSIPGIDRRKSDRRQESAVQDKGSLFYHFLASTYHDMEFLFQSISQQNTVSYFYFGDMAKDLFYISDNMRDEFGFRSNVVPGLLKEWAKRIPSPQYRDMYRRQIQTMLLEKRTVHDLRYQIRNAAGKTIWIRCFGLLKWNEDKTQPLFFAGRVTHQDDDFVVDPVTNFPRATAMFSRVEQLRQAGRQCLAIGFSLNSITELNNARGRTSSDHLVSNIADELMKNLMDKMSFYRLEGMRYMALVDPACAESREELVHQIREIVENGYKSVGLSVHHPCSFALMECPKARLTPSDFVENMVSLIKVAKQDSKQLFVVDSQENSEKIRNMSNIALALSRDVLRGMENFRIVIQPVVSVQTGQVVGGEVLLRWTFQGQDISPAVFIPLLEKGNLIQLAGRWVFEQAACNCMRLTSCMPEFYLTFNMSLQQLSDDQFTDFMRATLEKYRVSGSNLVAEMTESSMDERPEQLMRFVDACRELDIGIALDDFGSGYSSLRMLLQYPSSIIKLDRSLLLEMVASEDKMNFISSIVYACHRFGKKVCMEGVETWAQDGIIRECGCDMIQGFYYYRPMELEDVYSLVSKEAEAAPEKPKKEEQ
ncbi:EAL domain-containing protein [uncultured Allofournierella sp.]|uniref:EAL domain-containing protein n=1 Tax=uncultured Allofournierella sp. TaxID=1940258 RepID=UPI0025D4FD53|nr:EAL domain-containing protein [uncultured Fournierella sp.]